MMKGLVIYLGDQLHRSIAPCVEVVLRYLPRNYYKSSPRRFVVAGTKALDTRIG
jgi:hypothetical protein